jgi:hypothetical protein
LCHSAYGGARRCVEGLEFTSDVGPSLLDPEPKWGLSRSSLYYIFDAIADYVSLPEFRGCPFDNADAEAPAGNVRGWPPRSAATGWNASSSS